MSERVLELEDCTVLARQEKVVRDKKANEYFRRGVEAANVSNQANDQLFAIENSNFAISIRNNQARYYSSRANCFRTIGEFASAVEDYTHSIELEPLNPVFYANRSVCYRKIGNSVAALKDLTYAIEYDTKKGNQYMSRAMVLYEEQLYKFAIIDFNRALEEKDFNHRYEFRAYYSRSHCYRRLGQFGISIRNSVQFKFRRIANAIEDAKRAVKVDDRNASGYNLLGQLYVQVKNHELAIQDYTEAINIQDDNAMYYNNRGLAFMQTEKEGYRAGFLDFHKAIQLNGSDASFYFNRGQARFLLAELKKAPPKVKKSEQENDQEDQTVPFSAKEQYEAALLDFDQARILKSDNIKYILAVGFLQEKLGQFKLALLQFQDVLGMHPNHLDAKFHLALMYQTLNHVTQSQTILEELHESLPNDIDLLEFLGLGFQEHLSNEKACQVYEQLLASDKENPWVSYFYGESLLRLEQYDQAIASLSISIDSGMTTGATYNARGMAYRGNSCYLEAIQDLSCALRYDARNAVIRLNRSICYVEKELYEHAAADLAIAYAVMPEDFRVSYYSGLASYYQEMHETAIDWFSKALQLDPRVDEVPDTYYHLGLSYANLEMHELAQQSFSFAIASLKKVQNKSSMHRLECIRYLHERAKSYQLDGKEENALKDFNMVILANPNNAHAYFRRGFLHKTFGNLSLAADDFETAKMLDPENPNLLVQYKMLHDTECIVLCPPGEEPIF